jgi:hypothetical protein
LNILLAEGIKDGHCLLECVPYATSQSYASFPIGLDEQDLDSKYFLRSDVTFLVSNYNRITGNTTSETVFQKVKLYRTIKAMESEGNVSESGDIQTPGYAMIKSLVDWMDITSTKATEFIETVRPAAMWHDDYVEMEEKKLAQKYAAMQDERAAFFKHKAALWHISEMVLNVCPSYKKAIKNNYKPSEQQWDRLLEKLIVEVPRVEVSSSSYSGLYASYQKP